ncbi:MAG TPA: DUF1295 domain-containing protein [Candidatus Saccharimonadales bacterium]|nr:DUF1295 domain-containing protein [Candidatus Saccharimonadales bacterium]
MEALVFWLGLGGVVLVYMTLWYGVALRAGRYDVVDSAWGLGFVLVAWLSLALRGNVGALQVVSAVLVSAWGIRLFLHIASRTLLRPAEDHRYQELRARWGKSEKRKAYTNIFLLQGFLIGVVSTPMVALAFAPSAIHPLAYAGWAVWLFGLAFEAVADRQLATFLAHRGGKLSAIMQSGLWRYSRHPNYFGEVTVWWGAALVAISTGAWWGILGAATITLLITKVSGIPPLEKHYAGNEAYETYRKHTSVLIPWPPRKG